MIRKKKRENSNKVIDGATRFYKLNQKDCLQFVCVIYPGLPLLIYQIFQSAKLTQHWVLPPQCVNGLLMRAKHLSHRPNLNNGFVMRVAAPMIWSQLSKCSQLSQLITIVATPITIVAKSTTVATATATSTTIVQILSKTNFQLVNIDMWLKDDISFIVFDLNHIFHIIVATLPS